MKQESVLSRSFAIFNYALLGLMALLAILPFYYIILVSFTPISVYNANTIMLYPKGFSVEGFLHILQSKSIPRSLLNSVWLSVSGVFLYLALNILTAYPLAEKSLIGRKQIQLMITFTMIFSGGIVPLFIVVHLLGLYNSWWAVLLPGAVSAWSVIIFRSFFATISDEMKESARIDGSGEWRILASIVLPVCKPLIATFVVLFSVSIWNAYFTPLLFLDDIKKWPIQVILQQMLATNDDGSGEIIAMPSEMLKMSVTVVATVPILAIYPFMQKYFTQGLMIGSVKG